MFKKFMAVLCAANIMFGAAVCAWAAEDKPAGEKVEISFKVGDSTLKINKENVTVEKPFVVDGVTLVPVRVITEAFGAEVDWDGSTKKIEITYSDVEIQLTIDKKEAYVNNSRVELLAAPTLVGDTTMLPLRFITENFGADVSYDAADGAILVEKEITESDSILDYAMILKRSDKEKAGDAYLGWSIDRSPKFKLVERSFDGYLNQFYDESRDAYVSVIIKLHRDATVDSLLEDCRDAIKNTTVSKLDKATASDGTPFMYAQYKDADRHYYDKVFVKGDKLYGVYAMMSTETNKKEFKEIMALADTFSLHFDAAKTENLSDVKSETDMHTYRSKTMGIEMDIPGAYLCRESVDKVNEATFIHYNDTKDSSNFNLIHISLYSVQDGRNYHAMAERDLKHNIDESNPAFASYSSITDTSVDGKKAAYYDYEVKRGDKKSFVRDLFIDASEYYYNIAIDVMDSANAKAEVEKILNTIKFTSFDKEELGLMIRTYVEDETFKSYKNENMGVSFEAPSNWRESKDTTNILVGDSVSTRSVVVSGVSKAGADRIPSLGEVAEQIMNNTATDKLVTLDKNGMQTIKINNQTAYWFKYLYKPEGTSTNIVIYNYVCNAGDKFIIAAFQCPEENDGAHSQQLREKFINTLKFE